MAEIDPKAIELLLTLSRATEEEIEAVRALSDEQLDVELTAAGIDFSRFSRRLTHELAGQRAPAPSQASQPLFEWRTAGRHWLRATQAGLQQLAKAFDVAPMPLGARRPTGQAEPLALEAAQTWVPAMLGHRKGTYRLLLKCREATPPAQAPAVVLQVNADTLASEAYAVDYQAERGVLAVRFQSAVDLSEAVCEVGVAEADGEPLMVRISAS